MKEQWYSKTLENYVIGIRREFHMYPELSLEETRTSNRICEELDHMNIPYEIVDDKNVIGKIFFSKGKKIAIRADFDALPIQETVTVPWKSKNAGVMHACGHDGHAAILLGTAKHLLEISSEITGTIYLCFQHAEEVGQGADKCVDYLKSEGGVDHVIGIHLSTFLEMGEIDLKSGVRANGALLFDINIQGKSGHSSRPDLSVNPIIIASDLVKQLVAIPSQYLEPSNNCVVCPCIMTSGNGFNIIPNSSNLKGSVRFTTNEEREIISKEIKSLSQKIANIYSGSVEVEITAASKYAIVNDIKTTTIGIDIAKNLGFLVLDLPILSASDNFSEFLHAFPGFYAFVGARSLRENTSNMHHSANFDFNEEIMIKTVQFFTECVKKLT